MIQTFSNGMGGFGRPFLLDRSAVLIGTLAFVAAWLVPNHYPPWNSFYNEAAAFAGLLVWAVSHRRALGARPAPRVAWFIWAIVLVPIAQWRFGLLGYSSDALLAVLYLTALAGAVIVGSAGRREGRLLIDLSTAVLIASTVSSFIALTQVVDVGASNPWKLDVPPGLQPVGNLGHWNILATLIGLGTVALLVLFEAGVLGAGAAIALGCVLVVGLGLTRSRTGLVYGPIVWVALAWARQRRIHLRTSLTVVAAAVLGCFIVHVGLAAVLRALLLAGNSTVDARGMVETPRWRMWTMLAHSVASVPWSGYGWQQVGAAELAVVNLYPPIDELFLASHDLLLDLVIWNGIPLGALLSLSLVGWFVSRWRRVVSTETLFAMLSVTIVLTHSLLEFPHLYAYFLIPVGLWVGIVEGTGTSRHALSRRMAWLPLAVCTVIGVAVAKDYPAVEEDFRLVRFQNLRIGAPAPAAESVEAPFLSSLTAFLTVSRTEPRPGMRADELEAFERLAHRYPYPVALARTARALALNGRVREAEERFTAIRQMFGAGTYRSLRKELADAAPGSSALQDLLRRLPP